MKAFLCVYRHPIIAPRDLRKAQRGAATHPDLQVFLDRYFQPDCRYDWGDDPSFFQATHRLGDPRLASWGVCRWEVRQQLQPGDLVIFICGYEGPEKQSWEYYYIGHGTVLHTLQREGIFQNDQFAAYRPFFNMISTWERGQVTQGEAFGDTHGHFIDRCQAGYILFQPDATDFNLTGSLPIARFDKGNAAERWYTGDPLVAGLQHALFLDGTIDRGLNTGNWRRPHVHIPIHKHLDKVGRLDELIDLRPKLTRLSAEIRTRKEPSP
ncbi:hypothetical protein Q4E93_34395 [Flavitalea sp. BT771]|uniref:hypothetical protein n=1 Tax=Flavitalea sp. BT771 TaxID=3063329 RepID=UPI0026E3618B|nr:hypothetical protein [Flavitalea sp. BT771]MDO6435756.1 hypothetical protein [Flavitalea sp. BT771]MDV6224657.1 hypothetical protein [Flavitalea sp. BT771]